MLVQSKPRYKLLFGPKSSPGHQRVEVHRNSPQRVEKPPGALKIARKLSPSLSRITVPRNNTQKRAQVPWDLIKLMLSCIEIPEKRLTPKPFTPKLNLYLLIYGSVQQKRATERARCLFRVKGALFNSLIIVCCVFEKKTKDLYR